MTKQKPGRSGLTGEGGAVRRLLKQSEQKERAKETKGRGQAGHGGKRGLDKTGRAKMTVSMSLDLQEMVREMSEDAGTFPADVVCLAIARLHSDWSAGQVDFLDYSLPSNHPRAAVRLALEPVHKFTRPAPEEEPE